MFPADTADVLQQRVLPRDGHREDEGIERGIIGKLSVSTAMDWQVREHVCAKLGILVRCALQKWKYQPDQRAAAVELVLKRAETFSSGQSR